MTLGVVLLKVGAFEFVECLPPHRADAQPVQSGENIGIVLVVTRIPEDGLPQGAVRGSARFLMFAGTPLGGGFVGEMGLDRFF